MSSGSGGHRALTHPALRIAVDDLDPSSLEPGQIIADRFVLYGPPKVDDATWHVCAVDAQRKLGAPPHHRIRLEFIPCPGDRKELLLRALENPPHLVDPAWAIIDTPRGLLVATRPTPQRARDNAGHPPVVHARLAAYLRDRHQQGVAGLRFRKADLIVRDGKAAITGFSHLAAVESGTPASRSRDVECMLAFVDAAWPRRRAKGRPEQSSDDRGLSHPSERDPTEQPELPIEPPFVGREQELTTLRRSFESVREGKAMAIAITGEGGIGKSRLLSEFVQELRSKEQSAALVLESVGTAGASTLADALRNLLDVASPHCPESKAMTERVIDEIGELTSVIVRFTPELRALFGSSSTPPPAELDDDYIRHIRVVADTLRALGTQSRPLVLVIDEADRIDSGSLAVLQDLLEHPDHATLLVLASREDCPTISPNEAIRLAPLREHELEAFVCNAIGRTSSGALRVLGEHTHGVPWTAWSIVQAWAHAGLLARGEEGWHLADTAPPPRVESMLSHRVRALPPDARWLLLLATVRGEQTERSWLAQAGDLSTVRTQEATEDLVNARLLLPQGDFLRLPHGFVRDAVLAESNDNDVRSAHLHIARWLRRQPSAVSSAQLAYHEDRSGAADPGELLRLHLEGAQELLRVYDLDQAGWHFDQALRRADDPIPRAEALEGLADVDVLSGRLESAATRYSAVIQNHPDTVRAIEVGAKGTHALYAKSARQLALDVGRLALARAGEPTGSTKLQLLTRLPFEMALSGHAPNVDHRRRDALCRLYPDLIGASLAADPLAVAFYVFRSRRLANGLNSSDAALTLTFFAGLRGNLGHYSAARQVLQRAESLATSAGDAWVLGVISHIRAHVVELPSGSYQQGQASLDRAVEFFRRSGNLSLAPISLFFKAAYGRNREPVEQVLHWLREADRMARRHGNKLALPGIEALRLYVNARAGNQAQAIELEALSGTLLSLDLIPPDRLVAHAFLSLAWLESGDLTRARLELERSKHLAPNTPGTPELCEEWHVANAMVLASVIDRKRQDRMSLARSIKRLKNARRRSPRLWAASLLASCMASHGEGRWKRALRSAEMLNMSLDSHGESTVAARAARLLDGDQQREPTQALAPRPVLREQACPAPPQLAVSLSRHSGVQHRANLGDVLDRIRSSAPAIAPDIPLVYVSTEGALVVLMSERAVEALLVHLVCAVRDALANPDRLVVSAAHRVLTEVDAARAAGGRAGHYAAIRVEGGPGPIASFVSGLRACRRLLRTVDGFLETQESSDDTFTVTAYLPVAPSQTQRVTRSESATVVHPDSRVRETVTSSLREIGFDCTSHSAASEVNAPQPLLFIDHSFGAVAEHRWPECRVIHLVPRTLARSSPAAAELRVPFATAELVRLLARLSDDQAIDRESPTV